MFRPGLYIRAFCQGVDNLLEPYRKSLLDLEKQLVADPNLTAAHVQYTVERYQLLFLSLSGIVDEITTNHVSGCNLLELLHKATSCGVEDVKEAFKSVLQTCHGVLYKQLSAWMLHGLLIDQFSEFFIYKVSKKDVVSSESKPPVDEDQDLGGVTGKQLDYILKLSSITATVDVQSDVDDSYETYAVKAECLPSYIPVRDAEKILFIGESVHMVEKHENNVKRGSRTRSIMCDKENEFSAQLLQLCEQRNFDLMAFEDVIDSIRLYAAERLWQLVVGEADLVSQLRIMKDFFLLGRGELFLEFIDLAQPQLKAPPVSTTQHDVNLSFQQAARNILLDNEQLIKHFTIIIEPKRGSSTTDADCSRSANDSVGNRNTLSGWSCLRLVASIDWPLHIFFTGSVLARYNTLFSFLLYVKRIQMELHQCWALQMQRRHMQCAVDVGSTSKWWLRNHMAFIVDNLQYYLQVDVIESQFSVLLKHIEDTHDFEAIRLAHDHFLSALLSQSFLHMKQICYCLNEILELCHAFCALMTYSNVVLSIQEQQQLDDISKGFQRQSSLLFKLLSSVRTHQSSAHLAQLLLRIDFNRYFTTASTCKLSVNSFSNE